MCCLYLEMICILTGHHDTLTTDDVRGTGIRTSWREHDGSELDSCCFHYVSSTQHFSPCVKAAACMSVASVFWSVSIMLHDPLSPPPEQSLVRRL